MSEKLIPDTNIQPEQNGVTNGEMRKITQLSGMFKDWFLDYASYVILERAVPHVNDGLKPVQRRILHAMKKLDDGRFNKVANIIGHTMQYHPHGDTSIGDALVQLGQKELLVDMQGNWGNIFTGDKSAAARYIEARLSKFALEILFNAKTTEWQLSYDGRNKEPITLPVKFPLLLAQGVEGIAVGLASKILPHNFVELVEACIAYLKNKEFVLYPDFPTAGMMDVSRYNDGLRGGQIKVRAKIEKINNKILVIREIPFGKTTNSLIDSIIRANDSGKIKIKKIDDNTAENVEIIIHLAPKVSSDKTIDALYAFTDCEISISPNSCVIKDEIPQFLGVSEILKISTDNTVNLLKRELEIRQKELEEAWHFASLERIFIEKRIYRKIEECKTWRSVISTIQKGLKPHIEHLVRKVTEEDIVRLTEIKIKRISKYDMDRAKQKIEAIEDEIEEVKVHIENIISYAIRYFQAIKTKYGKNRKRKTEIRSFENIVAAKVVVANEKLYVNRKDGFIGTGLKKDEFVCDCSDIDDILIFRNDGTYFVTNVDEKIFVGKSLRHIAVFKKNDKRTVYNVAYRDGRKGNVYVKRFFISKIQKDKEYDLTKGTQGSKILYFSANPNGEAEVIKIVLRPNPRLKKPIFEFDFAALAIKSRNALGNILTKRPIHRISFKEEGVSTLGGRKIWFDNDVKRLNAEERGKYLGEFNGEDQILFFTEKGEFRISNFDLSNHFEEGLCFIEKFHAEKIWTIVFFNADMQFYYLKRFKIENGNRITRFIGENPESKLKYFTDAVNAQFTIYFKGENAEKEPMIINANDFIKVKSYKAKGKRMTHLMVDRIENTTQPLEEITIDDKSETIEETEVVGDEKKIIKPVEPDKKIVKKLPKKPVVNKKKDDDGQMQLF